MGSPFRKIEKNARQFELKQFCANMTPEQYQAGIRNAVKIATEDLAKQYDRNLERLTKEYNQKISTGIRLAIDTLSVEMIYELGNRLECYKENPENLDQKIDVVQGIYEAAMNAIEKYTTYKRNGYAHKKFEQKKKLVEKTFGIEFDKIEKEK